MGESAQDKAQQRADLNLGMFMKELEGLNTNVPNRFENIDLYGYSDYKNALDKAAALSTKQLTTLNNEQKTQNLSNIGQSLASQGITGGSILNNLQNKSATASDTNLKNSLLGLDISRMRQEPGLMQMDNANKLNLTQAQQQADQMNFNNLLSKYGLKAQAVGMQGAGVGNYSDVTSGDAFGQALALGLKTYLAAQGGG